MKNEARHAGVVGPAARWALSVALLAASWTQVQGASLYAEQSELVRGSRVIASLGSNVFGDKVSLYTGALEFVQTDVSLPGNNALPVAAGRRLTTGTKAFFALGHFGRWDLEVPRIHGIFSQHQGWIVRGANQPDRHNRCSQFDAPPEAVGATGSGGAWAPSEFWRGTNLYVPGAGDQEILRRFSGDNVIQPTGQSYPLLTTGRWVLRCGVTIANPKGPSGPQNDKNDYGEGFEALSPDGTRYRFDWMVKRNVGVMLKPYTQGPSGPANPNPDDPPEASRDGTAGTNAIGGTPSASAESRMPREEYWLMPTLITDRFGNTVELQFNDATDPWRLTKIVASDQRQLTFTYDGSNAANTHRIASVSDGTRTWHYTYTDDDLTSVTLPDNSAWTFTDTALLTQAGNSLGANCEQPGSAAYIPGHATFTHPSGAVGTFLMDNALHARSMVPQECLYQGGTTPLAGAYARYPRYFSTNAIKQKTISGPGLPTETWAYTYSDATGQASWDTCTSGCATTKTVDVTGPRGDVTRHTFGIRWKIDEGQLLKTEEGFGSTTTRVTNHRYRAPAASANPWPDPVGETVVDLGDTPMSARWFPQDQKLITVQGTDFKWEATSFDDQSRPLAVTRTGPGGTRTEVTSYHDNKASWMLGQVATVVSAGQTMVENDYHTSTAQLLSTKTFGKLQQRMTYNTDGTLASKSDPADHATIFRNYKRGLPQNVDYPDGTGESAYVNDIGNVESVTNAATYTTSYGYDAMGRLNLITPPAGWSQTTLDFAPVSNPEYDIPGGHWRQTITRGKAVTVNYFDALWRTLMSRTYDSDDAGNTAKVVIRQFDADGHPTYESYPQRAVNSVTGALPGGKRTYYDVLGRAWKTEADSELGVLTTTTEYLTGFQTKTTNPRNVVTTQGFWALDNPAEASLSAATLAQGSPRQAAVGIYRDAFGKPTSITRSGNYAGQSAVSVTRSYVYDAHHRLCKTIEPEIKATVQDYDAAGNVAWRAPGVDLTVPGTCDAASVAESAKIKYGYDEVNQLRTVTYGDASPGITRTYTADGLLATIETGGSKPSLWTYHYNSARLLDEEKLTFKGETYKFFHSFTSNALPSILTYPDNSVVMLNPNGLGEARQAGGFATNVSYYPNGAVAGFTFGNTIPHSLSQNTRGLPLVNQDGNVLKDQYTYDANGNVTGITDNRSTPVDGAFNRAMEYDELDRLASASAPAGTWGSATYTYDPVDNLRTANVGSRSVALNYADGTNKLTSLVVNGTTQSYLYDPRGNIKAKGAQTFDFDLGNRLKTASPGQSYTYDGHGRRLEVVDGAGVARLQIYSQAGQLLWADAPGTPGSVPAKLTYTCSPGTVQNDKCMHVTTYDAISELRCNGDDVLNGGQCTGSATSSYGATAIYKCLGTDTLNVTTCTTPASTYKAKVEYLCTLGDLLVDTRCYHTTSTTYEATVLTWDCHPGDSGVGRNCVHVTFTPADPVYECPANYSRVGSTCYGTKSEPAYESWTCNGHGSLQPDGSTCLVLQTSKSPYSDGRVECQQVADSLLLWLNEYLEISEKLVRCYIGPVPVYTCPNGGTHNNLVCNGVPDQQQAVQNGWNCANGAVEAGQCKISTPYLGDPATYNCDLGGSRSGGACTLETTTNYLATPTYICNAGDSRTGIDSCIHDASTYEATVDRYSCGAGFELYDTNRCRKIPYAAFAGVAHCNPGDQQNGSTCTGVTYTEAVAEYTCQSGATPVNNQCPGAARRKSTAYIYLAGKQVAEVETDNDVSTAQYVHTDALGSPVAHTNAAAQELNRTRFEPYGYAAAGSKPGVTTAGQMTTGSAIGFTGHVNDPATDLMYMQQRYYDPIAGRFLSVDPVMTDSDTGRGINRYAYANSNPFVYRDPTGMLECKDMGGNCISVGDNVHSSDTTSTPNGKEGAQSTPPPSPAAGAPAPSVQLTAAQRAQVLAFLDRLLNGECGKTVICGIPPLPLGGVGPAAAKTTAAVTEISFAARATRNSATQLKIEMSQAQAIENLAANGFVKSMSKDGTVTIMTNGEKVFRFYSRSTGGGIAGVESGLPSASVSVLDKLIAKLRFLGE